MRRYAVRMVVVVAAAVIGFYFDEFAAGLGGDNVVGAISRGTER